MKDMNDNEQALELLKQLNQKMDKLDHRFEQVERKAVISGATAGAISGGIVAAVVTVIRTKLGM
ncbi:hypothetical protein [Wohlfahrtiimonas larvae]|uniref:Bacteriocin n=1 Tax=Wohlfahrtiimonas larvae TaxID=1157986 RepID=A0ABP9MV87_9GAMM|nr:hypothetical protein [Wohlfahrtiimonas larvae]